MLIRSFIGLLVLAFVLCTSANADEWGGRKVVVDGHGDLSATFNVATEQWTTQLDLGEFDDPGLLFSFDDVLLVVSDGGRDEVTEEDEPGTFYGDLGPAGTPFWVIPINSQQGLIHLGFNAYGVSGGVFQASTYPSLGGGDNFPNGRVDFVLRDYSGPGNFVVFRTGPEGAMQIYMDSRDIGTPGIDNLVPEVPGGHSHQFMLFVGRGLHAVTMRNEGVLASNGQRVEGPDRAIPFLASPRGRHWWLLKHFDFQTALQLQSNLETPIASNGLPPLLSYAFGLDPLAPDTRGLPVARTINSGGVDSLALEIRRPLGTFSRDDRSDLQYIVEWSEDLVTWQPASSVAWEVIDADVDGTPRMRAIINDFELGEKTRAFARVLVVIDDDD